MSRNVYYEDVKIIKKPLALKIKLILSIVVIFLVLGGVVVSAFYISKSITVANLGSLFVYGGTKIKIGESVVYMLSLGEFNNRGDAEKVSLGATVQGASGFVWEKDNRYFVVGSMYKSNEDAEKVKNNLLGSSNYKAEVVQVKYPKINISFDDYENSDVDKIENAISFFDDVYLEVYNWSLKFDKGEINNLAISSGLSSLRGELKGFVSKIQTLLSTPNAKLQYIQDSLIKLDELMDSAIIRTIDNTGLNYYLKNVFVNVLKIKYDLFGNLQ